jgi:formylglycine-generating enzyme required for sulfatase activity
MDFNLENWREKVRDWWTEHGPHVKAAPIKSAYSLLAASAWLPFLAAYADDPGPAMMALMSITAGIGGNLAANVVQNAYDRARGGEQAARQAGKDAQIHEELDAILKATCALKAAQEALSERWEEFAQALVGEVAALPGHSSLVVAVAEGATVVGSVVAGDLTLKGGSIFVGGDYIERAEFVAPGDDRPSRDPEEALHAYLKRLTVECNVLHLRGMDPKAADVTSQETMSLAAVYTALDTVERLVAPIGAKQLVMQKEQAIGDESERRPMSAVEAASTFDCLVLLGDPGAGKSTFVNHLALRLAQAGLDGDGLEQLPGWTRGPLAPVRVVLRDLARARQTDQEGTAAALWGFVARTLDDSRLADAAPALEKRLEEGQVLLLLDGLDEVDAEARRWVLDAVADFVLTYQRTSIVVTCRVYAYQEPQWKLQGFEQVTLAPFDEEKINHFVAAWYDEVAKMGVMSVGEARERAGRLRDAVRRPDLRVLAPNPLLLTMMALLHSSWGRLPEDRVQLYSEIVELLLARWEESRLGRQALVQARMSASDLRFALEEVAYAIHESQPSGEGTADVTEALLRVVLQGYLEGDWNRAGDVLRYIRERAGLLLERKPGVYAFPHLTIQEYLAGCHLSVQDDFPSLVTDLLRQNETRWREPFLLAVGKTARAENRVSLALSAVDELCPRTCPERAEGAVKTSTEEIHYHCAWLAGEALLEIGADKLSQREAWQARLDRVAGWLARLLEAGALEPVERAAAGRVLGLLGDPRDLDELGFVPGGPFLMGSGDNDKEAYDDEKPQHTVEVDDFSIGKYPVTNKQYARFIEAGGYDERRYWTELGWAWRTGEREPDLSTIESEELRKNYTDWLAQRPPERRGKPFWWEDPQWNTPNYPVVGITWYEALAYCRWLGQVMGRECRLPTEAEWEKAARGGLPSPASGRGSEGEGKARIYPWSNEDITPRHANYSETGIGRTSPVGAFPVGKSPYGVLDMIGNVWEWCSSIGFNDAPYPYRANDGREDLEREAFRALRGGSWDSDRAYCRCAYRNVLRPVDFDNGIGFRVVFPGSWPSDF